MERTRRLIFLIILIGFVAASNLEGILFVINRPAYTEVQGVITDVDRYSHRHTATTYKIDVDYVYNGEDKHALSMDGFRQDKVGDFVTFYVTDNGYRYRKGFNADRVFWIATTALYAVFVIADYIKYKYN